MATSAPEVGTQSVLDAVFKELYPKERMEDASMKGHVFFSEVRKIDDFEGDQIVVPLQYGKPQGRSARYQSAISNRTASKTVKWVGTQKANYGYGHLEALAVRAARSNRGAFIRIIENEMDGVLAQHGDDIALDLYRKGTGAIAQVSTTTAPSGTTITLEDPEQAINLEVDMTIVFAAGDDGSTPRTGGARESLQIKAVDVDSGKITVDAAVTNIAGLTTGDYIFVDGDRESTMKKKILGLEAWLPLTAPTSGDNHLGVDRSKHVTRLAGHRQPDDGSPLPERLLKLAEKIARDKGRPTRCYMSHTNFTNLALEMSAKVEYEGGGAAPIGFASFPIHTSAGVVYVTADRDCPNNRFYMIDLSTWELHHLDGLPHLDTFDGNRVLRYTGGDTPQYQFQTISWAELFCTAPGKNGVGEIA